MYVIVTFTFTILWNLAILHILPKQKMTVRELIYISEVWFLLESKGEERLAVGVAQGGKLIWWVVNQAFSFNRALYLEELGMIDHWSTTEGTE